MSKADRLPVRLWQNVLLAVTALFIFVLLAESVIRVSGLDTDLVRNENFEIAVPVWLLADENWVDIQRDRLERPRGVRAADVAWLQYFEDARYIQYKLKPSISVSANNPFNEIELERGATFRLESNRYGFRTKEFESKLENVRRIVTLGDSSTFGWGVDSQYTYQELLEDRLIGSPPVEVFNLGISGHTSRHGRAVFDHYALDLDPDLLILSFGANDPRYVLQETDEMLAVDETWLGGARTVLMKFQMFRLLRRVIFSVYDPFEASRARAEREGDQRRLVQSVPEGQYTANLRYMITEGRRRGVETILLAICTPPEYVGYMRDVARVENVPLVDALEIFRARLDDLKTHRIYADEVRFYEELYGIDAMNNNWRYYVTTDGCHPGRAGHSLVADALEQAVNEVGIR